MAIVPGYTELTEPYWAGARKGRLVVQHCDACDRSWHPPLPCCPGCQSADIGWREVSGEGTVYSFTVVTHPTHRAFADRIPYVVAIVELAEGDRLRLVTGITGCAPEQVRVGMAVRATFVQVTDDITLPYFEPAT
jgi:uncharacterized OB-fold protein